MKKYLELEGNKVMCIHYMPFDPVNGLGKTEAELMQTGVLVDTVPDPEQRPGKSALPYYTPEKGFYYEYVDAPAGPASSDDIAALNSKLDYMGMMLDVL